MDLGAYLQAEYLSDVMKKNGISVPRLRGLRLMAIEDPLTMDDVVANAKSKVAFYAITSVPIWHPESCCFLLSNERKRMEKRYCIHDAEGTVVDLKWEKVHGKRRRRCRLAVKKLIKRQRSQIETFNKYAGRDDVLYIHARIGGKNWEWYGGRDLEKQPWFIEKVDDWFDCTYCDIYAKIEEVNE